MKIKANRSVKSYDSVPIHQCLAAFTALLNIITSGMHYGWPSPSLPYLLQETNDTNKVTITNDEGSWIAVMPLLGAVVGCLIAGTTVDVVGRKRSILLNSVPYFISWVMVAFANSATLLFCARFIAGISDGCIFTAVPIYIGEIANPNIRGFLGSSVSMAWIVGILLVNIIGSYLSIMTTALISSAVPLLCLITFAWMPESPYQLLMNNKEREAKKNLQIFRGKEDVDSEISRIHTALKEQLANSGKFLDLVSVKSNRKALLIMLALRTAQQLSGTTAITFYSQHIFMEAGDDISPELASIIYFSVQVVMCVFCSSIVDKTGRRPLLIISIIGSGIALFLEGTYFYIQTNTSIDVSSISFVPVAALVGFVVVFSLGMQTIPILLLGELFPANVKAFALCLIDIYFSIIASAVSKFFQIMKDDFGMFVPFYAFSLFCVMGLVFVVIFVPETKGKTLEEIQDFLRGRITYEDYLKNNHKADV